MIKNFYIDNHKRYHFSTELINSPVCFGHNNESNNVCGEVTYISKDHKIINIRINDDSHVYRMLKAGDPGVKLDIIYDKIVGKKKKYIKAFGLYIGNETNQVVMSDLFI